MTGSDALFAIASIAVTFAGFASVVTALRSLPGGYWGPEDAYRLAIMIQNSIATVFLSLLPPMLQHLGVAEGTPWRVASVCLMLYLSVALPRFWIRGRALRPTTALNDSIGIGVSLLAVAAFVLQMVNVLDGAPARRVGLYVAGLLVLLAISMVPFVRLVSINPSGEQGSPDGSDG